MNLPMVEIKIEVLEEVLKTVDAKIETVDAEDSAALSVRLCHQFCTVCYIFTEISDFQ